MRLDGDVLVRAADNTMAWERQSSGSLSDDAGLRRWIAAEVSRAVLEELPSMIGRITDRVMTSFGERDAAMHAVQEAAVMVRGRKPEVLIRQRKRKRESANQCLDCGQEGHWRRDCELGVRA